MSPALRGRRRDPLRQRRCARRHRGTLLPRQPRDPGHDRRDARRGGVHRAVPAQRAGRLASGRGARPRRGCRPRAARRARSPLRRAGQRRRRGGADAARAGDRDGAGAALSPGDRHQRRARAVRAHARAAPGSCRTSTSCSRATAISAASPTRSPTGARWTAWASTPAQCLVIEDSRRGLDAARAAGIACWVIPSGLTARRVIRRRRRGPARPRRGGRAALLQARPVGPKFDALGAHDGAAVDEDDLEHDVGRRAGLEHLPAALVEQLEELVVGRRLAAVAAALAQVHELAEQRREVGGRGRHRLAVRDADRDRTRDDLDDR